MFLGSLLLISIYNCFAPIVCPCFPFERPLIHVSLVLKLEDGSEGVDWVLNKSGMGLYKKVKKIGTDPEKTRTGFKISVELL